MHGYGIVREPSIWCFITSARSLKRSLQPDRTSSEVYPHPARVLLRGVRLHGHDRRCALGALLEDVPPCVKDVQDKAASPCALYHRQQVRSDGQFCAVHAVAHTLRSACLSYLCLRYA